MVLYLNSHRQHHRECNINLLRLLKLSLGLNLFHRIESTRCRQFLLKFVRSKCKVFAIENAQKQICKKWPLSNESIFQIFWIRKRPQFQKLESTQKHYKNIWRVTIYGTQIIKARIKICSSIKGDKISLL